MSEGSNMGSNFLPREHIVDRSAMPVSIVGMVVLWEVGQLCRRFPRRLNCYCQNFGYHSNYTLT